MSFPVPQNYIFWWFKSEFLQFICEKNGRKSRDPARRLVDTKVNLGNSYTCFVNLSSPAIPINPLKNTKINSLVNNCLHVIQMSRDPALRACSRTTHRNFLIFCSKHSLCSRKIITFSLFGGNFKNEPVWPKLTQI